MKKIIYKTGTGIAIITPTRTIEDCMKDIPEGAEYKIINESEIPKDYPEFKGFMGLQTALNYDLTLNVARAKEIKKAKLRINREVFFKDLDNEKRDADILAAQGDTSALLTWAEKRKVLQDITKLVDSKKTIEEIKSVKLSI